jgi:hypothetical protein
LFRGSTSSVVFPGTGTVGGWLVARRQAQRRPEALGFLDNNDLLRIAVEDLDDATEALGSARLTKAIVTETS